MTTKQFRKVYDEGAKFTGPLFTAFCLREAGGAGPRVGLTVPRALGCAVIRNRIKRRMREAVRQSRARASASWQIVINPRRRTLTAPFAEIVSEVNNLFDRCVN
ncbi:MAG: ribonuclease P protein component [Bryobacteraceae bacterium]